MQDGDFFSEQLMQISSYRRSQSDLRDQQNGRAPRLKHRPHRRQINRGLARSRDAMKQHAGELACVHTLLDRLERRLLRRVELEVKQSGAGLQPETVNSAASSTISTMPRFTSVPSVVRGTSNDCRASTGALPPAAASVSISVCWLALSLP